MKCRDLRRSSGRLFFALYREIRRLNRFELFQLRCRPDAAQAPNLPFLDFLETV